MRMMSNPVPDGIAILSIFHSFVLNNKKEYDNESIDAHGSVRYVPVRHEHDEYGTPEDRR